MKTKQERANYKEENINNYHWYPEIMKLMFDTNC